MEILALITMQGIVCALLILVVISFGLRGQNVGNQDAYVDNKFDGYVCIDHSAGKSFEFYWHRWSTALDLGNKMWLTKMLMLIVHIIETFALITVMENRLCSIDTDGQQLLT